ncbi:hypothetical protein AwErysi_02070 [Erysipelotrichaceae bacterium]|nr:hypothetical protein AwErysi_02070 [Erysipelotrichaceae bacterium]
MQVIGFILHYKNILTLTEELKYENILEIDREANPDVFIEEMLRYFNIYSSIAWSKEALDDYLYNLAKELYRKSGLTNSPKYLEIKEKNKRKLKIKQWHLDTYFKYNHENAVILQKIDALKQMRNRFVHSNNDPISFKKSDTTTEPKQAQIANIAMHYDGKTKQYYEDYHKSGNALLLEMHTAILLQFITEYEHFILKMLQHPNNKNAYVKAFEQKMPYSLE